MTDFYEDLNDLDKIDWPLIADWHWNNTPDDNDRIRRKQAEFLVYRSFPIDWIEDIGVYDLKQKIAVESILQSYNYKITVNIQKKWYYFKKGQS